MRCGPERSWVSPHARHPVCAVTCGLALALTCLGLSAADAESVPVSPEEAAKAKVAAAELEKERDEARMRTFTELLARSEVIVLGEMDEVDQSNGKDTRIRVLEWLKGPSPEMLKQWRDPFLQKRAQALLDEQVKIELENRKAVGNTPPKTPPPAAAKANPANAINSPNPSAPEPIPPLPLLVELGNVPRPGSKKTTLFFLWNRLPGTPEAPLRFKLEHPQNIYEDSLASEVRIELGKPRVSADRRVYLREWDRKMALRQQQHKLDDEIRAAEGGKTEKGMQIAAFTLARSVRDDNTFSITARLANDRPYDQALYDGPLSGFGVRIRSKQQSTSAAVVLRVSQRRMTENLDPSVLGILDANDFTTIVKQGEFFKDLQFDAQEYLELSGLDGPCLVSVFYYNDKFKNGIEDLVGIPWKGLVVSEERELIFKNQLGAGATGAASVEAAAVPATDQKKP